MSESPDFSDIAHTNTQQLNLETHRKLPQVKIAFEPNTQGPALVFLDSPLEYLREAKVALARSRDKKREKIEAFTCLTQTFNWDSASNVSTLLLQGAEVSAHFKILRDFLLVKVGASLESE